MHLIRRLTTVVALGLLVAPGAQAQDQGFLSVGDIDVDFLFNYYQQDGTKSPVTGGVGTEEMDVVSPVILVTWKVDEDWTLSTDLGADGISSASVDAIDQDVSSASEQDVRSYLNLRASRALGDDSTLTLLGGFSTEYDYQSFSGGLGWSKNLNQNNTTVSAQLRHFADTVDLYDIDGVQRGEDDRSTTDVTLGLTQVLDRRTLLSAELYVSQQSGFLSTPFHEVLLANGSTTTERLPDERQRSALGLSLNRSWTQRFVSRLSYRFYDDDWGIQAHTVEVEPHFLVSEASDLWVYPILRWHSQTASDYYAPAFTFLGGEEFLTVDGDLGEFTAEKYGIGFRRSFAAGRTGIFGRVRSVDSRITYYTREDGLESISASVGWRWRF
jgi:hypothetical protein